MACEVPDKIAAFASVAGAVLVRLQPKCQPKTPVSMLMINGTNDQDVRYEGDDDKSKREALVSIPETVELWRKLNKCTSSAQVQQLPDPNRSDSFQVKTSRSSGCSSNSEVIWRLS